MESFRFSKTQESQANQIQEKLMAILFFNSNDIICIDLVPHSQAVNKEYYEENLMKFRKRFRRNRPELFEF